MVEVSATGEEVGAITEPGELGHDTNTYGVAVDPVSDQLHVLDELGFFVPARVQLQCYEPVPPDADRGRPACTAAEMFQNPHLTGNSRT